MVSSDEQISVGFIYKNRHFFGKCVGIWPLGYISFYLLHFGQGRARSVLYVYLSIYLSKPINPSISICPSVSVYLYLYILLTPSSYISYFLVFLSPTFNLRYHHHLLHNCHYHQSSLPSSCTAAALVLSPTSSLFFSSLSLPSRTHTTYHYFELLCCQAVKSLQSFYNSQKVTQHSEMFLLCVVYSVLGLTFDCIIMYAFC